MMADAAPANQPPEISSSDYLAEGKLPTLRQILARAHLRYILLAVALAAASLVISGTVIITGYVRQNLELTVQTINYTIEPAIVFNDTEAIEKGVNSIAAMDSVARVEVIGPDGNYLANWERPTNGWKAHIEDAMSGYLWPSPAVSQVRRADKLLATIRVYGSASAILNYALSGIIITLACLGLTIVATRMLARRLQDDVIDPLVQVAQVAHAVRSERAFSERVPSAGIEEVDSFTQDFNALLSELEGWHEGLTLENAELERRATHDELTGLGNRVLFEKVLDEAIASASKTGIALAVIYLDANGFKKINDMHGHEAGDLALLEVSHRLRSSIRTVDVAYRLGGDEFALLMNPLIEATHLDHVIERIEMSMDNMLILPNGNPVKLSLSMGYAIFPSNGESAQALLRHADAAMYRDKKKRKQSIRNETNDA